MELIQSVGLLFTLWHNLIQQTQSILVVLT